MAHGLDDAPVELLKADPYLTARDTCVGVRVHPIRLEQRTGCEAS